MGGYCIQKSKACELANDNGHCLVSACVNQNAKNELYNRMISPKKDDGIYVQLFAVKDGVRYDMKVVSLGDVTNILTHSLMDGIEKLCT